MKIWETFRYELVYQMRSASTWIYFLFLLIVTYLLASEVFTDEAIVGNYSLNAPYYAARISVIAYIVGILILAPIPGNAATRDIETRMYPLLYTSPVSKLVYLSGRFLAAFALGAILMTAIPAGILGASLFPGEQVSLTGPIIPGAYLNSYFLFVLPNTFVAVALMFAVAVLSRRGISSFLMAISIFFIAFASWQLVAVNEGNWSLAKFLDPLGITLIQELKIIWSPLEKNTLMPGTQTWTLLNRLIWCLIALSSLALTYFRFRVEPISKSNKMGKGRRSKFSPTLESFHVSRDTPIAVPQVQQNFGFSTRVLQVVTVTRESFKVVMKWGWIAFACLAIFVFLTSSFWFSDFHNASQLPVSGHLLILLENHTYNGIWFIIPLLILFYAGELVWREREARLSEIIGAAPMPVWTSFAGKFAGLFLALVVLQVLMMICGMVVQARLGYYDFELPLYLKILFGIRLVDYTLLALLAFVIHVVVNQKYIGNLIMILFFVVLFYGYVIGIEPGLLVYGSDPGWTYSEIRGLEPYMYPWLMFKLYWAAWALLLAVVAKLLWPRGTERTFKQRIQEGSRLLTRQTKAVAAFAGLLIIILGGFIFYNTSILHPRTATPEGEAWKADYEKQYRKYANSPQPWLTGTNLHVEIYPKKREVDIRGSYDFVNRTREKIDSIHLSTGLGVNNHLIRFNRASRPELVDEGLGYHIYVLEKPLFPGDSLKLDFHVSSTPQGFPNYGIDPSLVENGSDFGNEWLPKIGYQLEREIDDPEERSEHGLQPKKDNWPKPDVARMGIAGGQERINFEAVVGTDKGQIAITSGKLVGSWMENGRSYFHYATEAPIKNKYGFFSADYDVHKAQWKPADSGHTVDIEILYHPGHTLNIERIVSGIQASLTYLTRNVGPCPHSEIRFHENIGYNKGMYANPTSIWYRTGYALLNQAEDSQKVDVTFATVAHEVAHQWYSAQLTPAMVEGSLLLSESLSWYSAFEIIEEARGEKEFLDLIYQFQQDYFSPQARAVQPLLLASEHNLVYRKGPLALYTLREYIGKEKMRMALQSLFKKNASGTPPLPIPGDLYRELQKVTPDTMQYLLHDLFATNTYWDLKTEQSSAKQTAGGNWEVSLDVQARKYTLDTLGVEADVPMDDWIQIGIFDKVDGNKGEREMLYLKLHRIRSGQQTIVVNLPRKAIYAAIDPNSLLMDLKRFDNISEVNLQQQE